LAWLLLICILSLTSDHNRHGPLNLSRPWQGFNDEEVHHVWQNALVVRCADCRLIAEHGHSARSQCPVAQQVRSNQLLLRRPYYSGYYSGYYTPYYSTGYYSTPYYASSYYTPYSYSGGYYAPAYYTSSYYAPPTYYQPVYSYYPGSYYYSGTFGGRWR
jgi:hypothetical protein